MLWASQTETQNTEVFQGTIFISMLTAAQEIHIQRLSPKNKGGSPYIPLQAGYRNKKQGLIHMWLHVTLLATSPTTM
jgi:hypothetical protein